MRVVCDTNVFVSALVFGGKPGRILDLARGRVIVIWTEAVRHELRRILTSKFGWTDQRVVAVLRELNRTLELVQPAISICACRDPDDDRILEAAVAGRADCIVSGDADLLSMKSFQQIPILTVSAFLELTER